MPRFDAMSRGLRLTEEQFKALRPRAPVRVPKAETPEGPVTSGGVRRRGMNRWESEHAQNLEIARRNGVITWFGYEAIKLRLANRTFFTPDFAIIGDDGVLYFDEVKGFMRDDAAVKLKVAAEQFPFAFYLVVKTKGGVWTSTRVG